MEERRGLQTESCMPLHSEIERGETEERAKWRKGEGYTLQTESCMPLHSETERGETEEKAKWRKGEGYRPKVVHTVT